MDADLITNCQELSNKLVCVLNANPILARVERSGIVDSVHRGRIAITDPEGALAFSAGDVGASGYPRSATKPLQAIAMLESGLDLAGEYLALAAASHSGEPMHRDAVEHVLAEVGLGITDLQNTPDFPIDEVARIAWIAAGRGRESLTQNCSGKHAAMLRTCMLAGWPTDSYREPQHPLQLAVGGVVERFSDESPRVGVDGCGAPAHTMSTVALARAYGRISSAREGAAAAVAEAYRTHPEFVSGTRRWEARLHRAVPGLICKYGAEATLAMGLPNGQGIAIKLDDGADRALPVIAVEALGLLGIRSEELTEIGSVPVLGHGRPVGEILCDLG